MTFSDDEFPFGPFANLGYALGQLEHPEFFDQRNLIHLQVIVDVGRDWMERFGFHASARSAREIVAILSGKSPYATGALHDHITALRSSLMAELEAQMFLPLDPSLARFYREPRRDWDEVIQRFPESLSDIEESSKCFALGRYAGIVFHCMQVLEHGLLSLGEFMQIPDPRSGFTAIANALQQITRKPYDQRTPFEKEHFAFFEQANGSVQAIKDAWRNKVSHAQGRAILMNAEFSQAVAQEIYIATRGFMRRLATDLPASKQQKSGWPWADARR